MNEDFVPDYIFKHSIGEIANKKSILQQSNEETVISLNNKLYVWNTWDLGVKKVIGDSKQILISSYCVFSFENEVFYVIGYESGIIKIFDSENSRISQFKAHNKKVTKIIQIDGYIATTSADGCILIYDVLNTEIKRNFVGCQYSIYDLQVFNGLLIGSCSDKVLRTWNKEKGEVESVYPFDSEIFEFVIFQKYILVFLEDGETLIYNYEKNVFQQFNTFKKLRKIQIFENNVYFMVKGKLFIYNLVESNNNLTLKDYKNLVISDNLVDFCILNNEKIFFLSSKNFLEVININTQESYSLNYHRNEIIGLEIKENNVLSLSDEKIINWNINEGELRKTSSFSFDDLELKANCFCVLNNLVFVGCNDRFIGINMNTSIQEMEENVGNVQTICSYGGNLFVGTENVLKIYEKTNTLNFIKELPVEDHIICVKVSNEIKYLGLSLLNNQIKIYEYKNMELKLSLYGHSLPVRNFDFSFDNKLLISCSADKLIKIWGLDYGECRKTFIGNSYNIEFLKENSSLFLVADKGISYYKKHEKLKEFKNFDAKFVKTGKDFFIAVGKYSINYYFMDEYEMLIEDSSEIEDELIHETKIANIKFYDSFLKNIEELELNFNDENLKKLYKSFYTMDLSELDKYFYLLDTVSIKVILDALKEVIDKNLFLISKIFLCIVRIHRNYVKEDENAFYIYKKILEKMKNLKDEIGCNLAYKNKRQI